MTTKDEDLRLADLLAMNVVTEVIDEAYVIANAALDSDAPWSYLEMVRSLRNEMKLDRTLIGEMTFKAKENLEANGNVLATSTPQKGSTTSSNSQIDSGYIGQGDEKSYLQDTIRNCTSTFINNLFDMSDVERVIICDGPEYSTQDYQHSAEDTNDMLQQALTKIANAFMSNTIVQLPENLLDLNEQPKIEEVPEESANYSYLEDVYKSDVLTKDVAFYIHDDTSNNIKGFDSTQTAVDEPTPENITTDKEIIETNYTAYENAYLSLNRDYEQASEENYPVIEEPKCMTYEEVELIKHSEIDLTPQEDTEQQELVTESTAFATASGSRKSLVRRCRMQGARFLACLRGWWRRKAHGRRKESRASGSVRGMYPLSPSMRSRTSSLIEERKLGSPTTRRSFRKFNTISEAVVKSCIWKDYRFEIKPRTT